MNKIKRKNNVLIAGSKNLNTENWKVHHPNGKHMFTCGESKAKWYLDRDLATKGRKKSITLTFMPKGDGFNDNELFGKSIRENKCVVTGITTNLQRHHIIPYCYRNHFDVKYKSKNHHDVVLIRCKSHSEYEQVANTFKDKIATMYGVKTISELNGEYSVSLRKFGKEYCMALSALKSLFFRCGTNSKKKLNENGIRKQIQVISNLTEIPFKTLATLNYLQFYKLYLLIKEDYNQNLKKYKKENKHLYDHGYRVVKKLNTEDKIDEFVKLWRHHFIDTMKPKYMPIGWSVDFRIKTKL